EAGGAEDADLAEELVDDIDAPVFVDIDTRRQHEAARVPRMAALADEHQQLPLRVEDLEVSERGVDDVDIPVRVGRDAARSRELSREAPDGAEARDEAAVRIEGLDPEVAAVDDMHPAVS